MQKPQAIKLRDYLPPAFLIERVELEFDLEPSGTIVESILHMYRNPVCQDQQQDLVLNGEHLELLELKLNDEQLSAEAYQLDEQSLTVSDLPNQFQLQIKTKICPEKNTALEGLYMSSGNFCTQCEAEGFRRITYYLDRPDVLAKFTTTIKADAKQYPVLLSNGNNVARGSLESGRHWVRWEDPFPKPCYLFALVAGDLAQIADSYTTTSGREVALHIYVQAHNRDKCEHAMRSLINSMRWDEQVFGLEYDLDIYMIVAVDDFNMGAMENKGLNVFNSKFVLARPDTATDTDFQQIEGVIGHEYFHNWTGNRVTCRDWFQLSLKEGLTVFRDQEFSSDMTARSLKRIQDVALLRTVQFDEDAGPMSHPVRPESYIEINNFYTVTVYEKGAELIRMQHTLLGAEKFRKGLDLYFERHDGQAVTTDDFVQAMQDASGINLEHFKVWYSQAGTPVLQVQAEYDAERSKYTLEFKQHTPPTPGQLEKQALHIPVAVGLLDQHGNDMPLETDSGEQSESTLVLNVQQDIQRITFVNVNEKPLPSLLRGFSAPVKLEYQYSDDELRTLMMKDSDSFNRWDASQRYAERVLWQKVDGVEASSEQAYVEAFAEILDMQQQDAGLLAEALRLPTEKYLGEQRVPQDPLAIHSARESLALSIANSLSEQLRYRYHELIDETYKLDADSVGRRALKNLCLYYLMQRANADAVELCVAQYRQSNNMTDRLAAVALLVDRGGALADDVLDDFYRSYQGDALVVDKWFAVQAGSKRNDTLKRVEQLTAHSAFSLTNPNKVRALIGAFCMNNPAQFHHESGLGYAFLANIIYQLDELNPQVAARLVGALNHWRRLVQPQQIKMREQLEHILAKTGLSRDVYEIVSKALDQEKA